MRRLALLAALAGGAVLLSAFTFGRGATLPGLPRDVQAYRSWPKVNAKPIPPSSASAHFGRKNVYARKRAAGGRYPYGSILVKEGVETGRSFVGLIAIMRKVKGSDPAHGDWRFVEYTRSDASQPFQELARDGTCWSCHAVAKKTDWVYTTG
jgi:hypothetical protein